MNNSAQIVIPMTNEKTVLGAAELDYLIFDLSARCKDKDGGTIHMRQCLMGLKELERFRTDRRALINRVCETSGGMCMAFHEHAECGPCTVENCKVMQAAQPPTVLCGEK